MVLFLKLCIVFLVLANRSNTPIRCSTVLITWNCGNGSLANEKQASFSKRTDVPYVPYHQDSDEEDFGRELRGAREDATVAARVVVQTAANDRCARDMMLLNYLIPQVPDISISL
jgi:hypothetical protein